MRTQLASLVFGLLAFACSSETPMDSNPAPKIPSSATQEATFAAG